MQYSDKILEHFMNPRNISEIHDADGIGTIGSEECGDCLQFAKTYSSQARACGNYVCRFPKKRSKKPKRGYETDE